MARLFGRLIPVTHPANLALDAMLAKAVGTQGEAVARAQVCNIRHDSRVSQARETATPLDWSAPDAFRQSYGSYYDKNVRTAGTPDFALRHNRGNIVFRAGMRNRLHSGLFLATLVDVGGLHDLYSLAAERAWTNAKGVSPFKSYPRNESATSRSVAMWIEARMNDDRRRRELIDATLEYMRVRLSQGAFFHPTWCAVYDDLRKTPLGRWPVVLGLGHWIGTRRWCFAVCYPVNRARVAAIPTVLDSKLSPYFFPSPPLTKSGHPVDLSLSGGGLTQEYIHSQISLLLADHVTAGGAYIHTRMYPLSLPQARKRHWTKLKARYRASTNVDRWMPRNAVT